MEYSAQNIKDFIASEYGAGWHDLDSKLGGAPDEIEHRWAAAPGAKGLASRANRAYAELWQDVESRLFGGVSADEIRAVERLLSAVPGSTIAYAPGVEYDELTVRQAWERANKGRNATNL